MRRVSTVIGVVLVLIGAIVGVIFVGRDTDFLPRARPEYRPQQVKITNISDTGFTLSWVTTEATIGFVKLGESPTDLNLTVTDDRDQLTGDSGEFKTHYLTIQGLKPQSSYYFKLGSHGKQLYDNNGAAFNLTTAASITPLPPVDSIYGTVLTPANTPAEGALVYVTLPGASPLSAIVKQNGSFAINLSQIRDASLNQYFSYDPNNTPYQLLIRDSQNEATTVTANTLNDQPLPTITLGQTSSEPSGSDQLTSNQTMIPESKFSLLPIETTDQPDNESGLTIVNPIQDGSVLKNPQPQFTGNAPANTQLTITLESAPIYTDSVLADASGKWSWTPPGNLTPGEHTLTLAYNDSNGVLRRVQRQFVVSAQDGSIQYTATPSSTLVPTRTPIIASTPTTTLAPSPTNPISPATTPATQPISGNPTPTLLLAVLSLLFIFTGFILAK